MQASDAKRDSKLLQRVMGTLNEAQRRWLVGREALRCGRGGIQRMVETSGLSKPTILKGIRELSGKSPLHPAFLTLPAQRSCPKRPGMPLIHERPGEQSP